MRNTELDALPQTVCCITCHREFALVKSFQYVHVPIHNASIKVEESEEWDLDELDVHNPFS